MGAFHSTKMSEISGPRMNGTVKIPGKGFENLGIRFEWTLYDGISGIIENFVFHSQEMSRLVSLPSVSSRGQWRAEKCTNAQRVALCRTISVFFYSINATICFLQPAMVCYSCSYAFFTPKRSAIVRYVSPFATLQRNSSMCFSASWNPLSVHYFLCQ